MPLKLIVGIVQCDKILAMADFLSAKIDWYKYNRPFSVIESHGGSAIACAGEIDTLEQKGVFDVIPQGEFFTDLRNEAARYRAKYYQGVAYDGDEKHFLRECLRFYKWANDFFGN